MTPDVAAAGVPDLTPLLWPDSVAVLGASANHRILRGRLMAMMGEHAYPGRLYPISRTETEVNGRPVLRGLAEVPEPVDLAVIMVPAAHVPAALEECARVGVKAAQIITSGFSEESGEAGRALQARIVAIARDSGMVVCGPNSEGFANTRLKLCPTFSPTMARDGAPLLAEPTALGSVSVIAQSGGIGFSFFDRARPKRVPVGYVVTTGNEACLDTAAVLSWLVERDDSDVFILFVEAVKDPAAFVRACERALALGKPVIAVKVGKSEAAARAAFSHTAALAGAHGGYRAMSRKLGVTEADDIDAAVDIAWGFAAWRHCLPRGRRVGIFTASGGAGGWMADSAAAAGLAVPVLDAETRATIDPHLPSYGTSVNPVDATAQAIGQLGYAGLLDRIAASPMIDAVVAVASARLSGRLDEDRAALEAYRRTAEKPALFWTYTLPHDNALRVMSETGYPLYDNQTNCARAIAALDRYRILRERAAMPDDGPRVDPGPVAAALSRAGPVLCEFEVKPLLAGYGIAVPREALATTAAEAVAAARRIGGTVALKLQSPDLPHKTEHGLLRLGLTGDAAVAETFTALMDKAGTLPGAPRLAGVLVQEMAPPGLELILGVARDQTFGPMLTAGLGGIFTEILADSVTLPCPVGAAEAESALTELAAWPVLAGARGRPRADIAALVDLMCRLSRLAADHAGQVTEIDLNPVILLPEGHGYRIVDALLAKG